MHELIRKYSSSEPVLRTLREDTEETVKRREKGSERVGHEH